MNRNNPAIQILIVANMQSQLKITSFINVCTFGRKKFDDTKGVIRSCKSKERQYSDQRKKNKRTNNNLNVQNTTQKTKDRATRIPLKSGSELWKGKQFLLHM